MKYILLFLALLLCPMAQSQWNIQPPSEGYFACPLINGRICRVTDYSGGRVNVIFGTPQKFTQPAMFMVDFPCFEVAWSETWLGLGTQINIPFVPLDKYSLCWIRPND